MDHLSDDMICEINSTIFNTAGKYYKIGQRDTLLNAAKLIETKYYNKKKLKVELLTFLTDVAEIINQVREGDIVKELDKEAYKFKNENNLDDFNIQE